MWDNRAIFNLALIISYSLCFNFYLYELFWGEWEMIMVKAFFYFTTSLTLGWCIVDEALGYKSTYQKQLNIICKFIILVNFCFMSLTLRDKLPNPIAVFIIFNVFNVIGGGWCFFWNSRTRLFKKSV